MEMEHTALKKANLLSHNHYFKHSCWQREDIDLTTFKKLSNLLNSNL